MKRTLYFGRPVYLSLKDKQLIVNYPDKEDGQRSASVEDVAVIILDNYRITITSPLLQFLLQHNVAVLQCDEKHLPQGMFYNLQGNNKHLETVKHQMDLSEARKSKLWQLIVRSKISNQAQLLEYYNIDIERMNRWVGKVSPGDTKNHEARASKYYWKQIFSDFIPDFHRNYDEMGVNGCLNFGYAVIRSLCARSLVATGLYPVLGLFHSNKYNPFCLADDVMEVYRPWVDKSVRLLLEEGIELNLNKKSVKKTLLSVPQEDAELGGRRYPLMKAVDRTAESLKQAIEKNNNDLLLPSMP